MDSSRDSSMVASGSSSSPAPSPYYIHHRPAQSPSSTATQPAIDDYRNHHFVASPGPGGGFSFQMGPDHHITQHQVQGPHSEASPPVSAEAKDDLAKKKRGRPRKYKPDGSAASPGLSPSPSQPSTALVVVPATPGPEKRRGRPPGSGKMQQLASLGESFLGTVGTGFTPRVIVIPPGEPG